MSFKWNLLLLFNIFYLHWCVCVCVWRELMTRKKKFVKEIKEKDPKKMCNMPRHFGWNNFLFGAQAVIEKTREGRHVFKSDDKQVRILIEILPLWYDLRAPMGHFPYPFTPLLIYAEIQILLRLILTHTLNIRTLNWLLLYYYSSTKIPHPFLIRLILIHLQSK